MPWTDLLTYTIARHLATLPCWSCVAMCAKKVPSIDMDERFAADKSSETGVSASCVNP